MGLALILRCSKLQHHWVSELGFLLLLAILQRLRDTRNELHVMYPWRESNSGLCISCTTIRTPYFFSCYLNNNPKTILGFIIGIFDIYKVVENISNLLNSQCLPCKLFLQNLLSNLSFVTDLYQFWINNNGSLLSEITVPPQLNPTFKKIILKHSEHVPFGKIFSGFHILVWAVPWYFENIQKLQKKGFDQIPIQCFIPYQDL